MVIRDHSSHIPFSNFLQSGDLLLLLTPVVPPVETDSGLDPFEPLGRGLAKHHPWVRHVPYTAQGGITSTHVGFIKRARVVVFVITGPTSIGQPSQVELSSVVQLIGERRPHVVVACCHVQELEPAAAAFSTVLQLPGISSHDLEIGADILFFGRPMQPPPPPPDIHVPRQPLLEHSWGVTDWNQARDIPEFHELWCQCMPPQFRLPLHGLLRVLQRDGYAKHFVVREPGSNLLLGFCATYITYFDNKEETLVGSVAALCVRAPHRGQGIGRALHDAAMRGFKKTRGVNRLQLGSTFPRLLYGLPVGHPSETWFKRRGWRMDCTVPGTGQEVSDWLLTFSEWPTGGLPSIGVDFRSCEFSDFDRVLEVVERESERNGNMAWYDQYAKLADSMSMTDIILGMRGDTVVAAAITYIPRSENPSAEDIPWAASISEDTGGTTCICITGMF
ncbi:hypothetical protein N0V82_008360 [Gnomoniopsis sp. IMI 355080]|nr:hypothetical protein N0V82_008360 [Gnomoniopsis sp. IMI 355080]